jgi:hypothetical protein
MDPAEPHYANPPAGSPWGAPPPAAAAAARRARAGIVVLAAVLTELVLIGAGANQSVSERIVRNQTGHDLSAQLFEDSWLTYTWRWDPTEGRIWWSHAMLIVTLAVVSGLLVWCVARGAVSFVRTLFGTWMAVIVASLLGAFVRGLLDPFSKGALPGSNAVTRAIFGPAGPNSEVVFGSFVLGLVVGLVAAVLAVTTARSAGVAPAAYEPAAFADYGPPAAAVASGALPPWQDQHYGPPARPMTPPFAHQPDQEPAEPGADQQATTQLPSLESEGQQATTRFPRPPDDETLGHVED